MVEFAGLLGDYQPTLVCPVDTYVTSVLYQLESCGFCSNVRVVL